MARKAVREISVALGDVSGLALAGAPAWSGGATVEGDKIAAYGDAGFTTVPRNVKSYPEATFTFIDEGDGKAALCEALVGTVVTVTFSTKYGDGKSTDTTSAASVDMAILECVPGGETEVDGDHKATFTVKAVRHAPGEASSSSASS